MRFVVDARTLVSDFQGTSKNSHFVIPAKAGIQSNQTAGCRIKSGMTNS